MALVRRTTAVGRASAPPPAWHAPTPVPAIPHQQSAPVSPSPAGSATAPSSVDDVAAAVPTRPAHGWAVLTGLGLAALGTLISYGIWFNNHAITPFRVDSQMSAFAALFVFAAAVERLLEPITRWMPGRRARHAYERALADMDKNVPGATMAAARSKAAMDRARSSQAMIMWGLATCLATVLSALGGFYLLRMISADPGWHAVPEWVDALVTGLVVGSGTKPLHDLISRVQKQKENAADPS